MRPHQLALLEEARAGRSELREQLDGFARALTDLSTRTDQRLDLLRIKLHQLDGDDAPIDALLDAARRSDTCAAEIETALDALLALLPGAGTSASVSATVTWAPARTHQRAMAMPEMPSPRIRTRRPCKCWA